MSNKFCYHTLYGENNAKQNLIEFTTFEDLLSKTEINKRYKTNGFCHFAKSDNCIMAIYEDGFVWWVVGFVSDPASIDLPKWDGGKYRVMQNFGESVVLGKDVSSTCGNEVRMKDGSVYKKAQSA